MSVISSERVFEVIRSPIISEKSTFISQNQYNKELIKLKIIFSDTVPISNSDWIREVIEEL